MICEVCKDALGVGRRLGSDTRIWLHVKDPAGRDHEPVPIGEGVTRLAAANRSIKIASDAVTRGGSTHTMAETLRLCIFQIQKFREWAHAHPDQQIAGAPEVDPEFDASRAYIPDTIEGL